MSERSDLGERLLDFGAQVVKLIASLPSNVVCQRIGDQLLRSATSVGANYQEAQAAESTADLVRKLQLALKKLREADYWLRLLQRAEIIPPGRLADVADEATQLKAIMSKALATAKGTSKS